ncbi:MAG TPA: DUF2339 domain-containing protein, partial [Geobacterales bacterium]|nr:DUF2339 domain-containing protein [Geobacterales bacterium]
HVEEEHPQIVIASHGLLFWLITFHLTWEVGEQMGRLTDGAPAWTAAARGGAMALVLTVVSLPAHRLLPPWRRFRSTYLTLGAWPVVVVILCWLLLAAPSLPGDPWFIPYYPLANPLDLASLALLISLVAWRLRLSEVIRPEPVATQAFTLFWGVGAFVWLNTLLLRTIHHYAFVDYSFQALFASNLVQTSLAIFWTLLALAAMVVGRRLARRHLWLTGAVLLAVVVLKLFFVDLAHTGTIARIVSFMGVGILLLAIGFLSPMPPQMNKGG